MIFIYVKTLIMSMLFLKQSRGRPGSSGHQVHSPWFSRALSKTYRGFTALTLSLCVTLKAFRKTQRFLLRKRTIPYTNIKTKLLRFKPRRTRNVSVGSWCCNIELYSDLVKHIPLWFNCSISRLRFRGAAHWPSQLCLTCRDYPAIFDTVSHH